MKWEYCILNCYSVNDNSQGVEETLERFGEEGWELVNAVHDFEDKDMPTFYLYLKRQIR